MPAKAVYRRNRHCLSTIERCASRGEHGRTPAAVAGIRRYGGCGITLDPVSSSHHQAIHRRRHGLGRPHCSGDGRLGDRDGGTRRVGSPRRRRNATTASLNGAVSAFNADARGSLRRRRVHRRRRRPERRLHRELERRSLERARRLAAERRRVRDRLSRRQGVRRRASSPNAGGNPNADFLAVWDGTQLGAVLQRDRARRSTGRSRAADHRLDALRRRDVRERRGHRLRRLPARVRPRHRRGELDGRRRTATSAAPSTRSPPTATAALYAGGGFINLDAHRRRRQRRVPRRRRLARDGQRDRTRRRRGRRASSAASPPAGPTSTSARTPIDVAGIPQADHVASGTARPGARRARTPPARTAGSRRPPPSTRITTTPDARLRRRLVSERETATRRADDIASFDGTSWSPSARTAPATAR